MWMLYIMMAIVVVPIAFYLYRFMKRMFKTFGGNAEATAAKVCIGVIAGLLGLLAMNIFGLGAIIILHIFFIALVVQLVNFVIKKVVKIKYDEGYKVWKWIYGSGVIPLMLTAILITYGYINMHNVVETYYEISTEKDIRDEGYRVAFLSDVHFSVSLTRDELQEKCDEISEKNVDIVILGGDIIDDNTSKEDTEKVFETLASIDSTYGVFYVYGNHDRQLYRTNREYTEDELINIIESNGIVILRDETYDINDDLVLVGREDKSYSAKERASIDELLAGVDKSKFILTADHQPKQYDENAKAGTDLLVSGHTHGGQIWPAQIIFELAKFDDAVYGHTQIDKDTQAIVSSGLAGWGYPVKTAAPAEYVIIDIKEK